VPRDTRDNQIKEIGVLTQKTVCSRFSVFLVFLAAALACWFSAAGLPAQAATPGTWTLTGSLNTARGSQMAGCW